MSAPRSRRTARPLLAHGGKRAILDPATIEFRDRMLRDERGVPRWMIPAPRRASPLSAPWAAPLACAAAILTLAVLPLPQSPLFEECLGSPLARGLAEAPDIASIWAADARRGSSHSVRSPSLDTSLEASRQRLVCAILTDHPTKGRARLGRAAEDALAQSLHQAATLAIASGEPEPQDWLSIGPDPSILADPQAVEALEDADTLEA